MIFPIPYKIKIKDSSLINTLPKIFNLLEC